MSEDLLRLLAGSGVPTAYETGDRLFAEGTPADRFWVIEHGDVALDMRVPGRGAQVIETLTAGAIVGWSWLYPPFRWQFGAVARDPVQTVVFDGVSVRDRCAADREFGYEMLRLFTPVITDRLQSARLRLLDLYAAPTHVGQS